MERKNADKEEQWHEDERQRRVEEHKKEEWKREEEEEKREERSKCIYLEEAEKQEMRLLEHLESKDKANIENQLRQFEKNKKLKSVPTWNAS